MRTHNCCGLGKIQYFSINSKAVPIECHHFIIVKTGTTMDFIDVETGLVTGFLYSNNNLQEEIRKAIERLAKMILQNALANIKKYGVETYKELMNSDISKEYSAVYQNLKRELDTMNKSKDKVVEKFDVDSKYKSETKYSCKIKKAA